MVQTPEKHYTINKQLKQKKTKTNHPGRFCAYGYSEGGIIMCMTLVYISITSKNWKLKG